MKNAHCNIPDSITDIFMSCLFKKPKENMQTFTFESLKLVDFAMFPIKRDLNDYHLFNLVKINILSVNQCLRKQIHVFMSLLGFYVCDVCCGGSPRVHAVSELSIESKFSCLNWLSLEPFNVPGHWSLKLVLNTLV